MDNNNGNMNIEIKLRFIKATCKVYNGYDVPCVDVETV